MVRKPKHTPIYSYNKRYIPLDKSHTIEEKYSLHDKDDSSLPYRKRACTRYNSLGKPLYSNVLLTDPYFNFKS